MKNLLEKFKIPTLLGLGIILVGIGVGVFLVLREQIYLSNAAPSQTPQNIKVSNIDDSQVSISWQTSSPSLGFVTFGQSSPGEETTLDGRDNKLPQSHLVHFVTLKNLLPKTTYQYRIVSGKITTEVFKFTTAPQGTTQSNLRPVIGTVLDGENPLDEGIAFVALSGASLQSSLVKSLGNFLIPLSSLRTADLSDLYSLSEEAQAKITIVSAKGEASAVFNLKPDGINLPPLKIGQGLDLTLSQPTPSPVPTQDLKIYDLNNDGKINSNDYSLALKNKDKRINGILIDQSYLNELIKMINSQNPTQRVQQ